MEAVGIESIGVDLPTVEASTSSFAGCGGCSSYSDSGCKPTNLFIAL
jgi:hypothetical protein